MAYLNSIWVEKGMPADIRDAAHHYWDSGDRPSYYYLLGRMTVRFDNRCDLSHFDANSKEHLAFTAGKRDEQARET